MVDTAYSRLNDTIFSFGKGEMLSDTLNNIDSTFLQKTFLGTSHVVIQPENIYHSGHEWLMMAMLSIVVVFAVINFLVPGKIWQTILFPFNYKEMAFGLKDHFVITTGHIIPVLFFMNFVMAVTTLVYLTYYNALPGMMLDFGERNLFLLIMVSVLIYLTANRLFIWITNLILDMTALARLHIRLNYYIEASTGMLLTFLLLIFFYTGMAVVLTSGLLLTLILLFYKWTLLLIMGIKLTKIHLLHLFLYLCTLELLPLLVAMKWLGNNIY